MKHLIVIAALLGAAQSAQAQKAVHVTGLLGFNAEVGYDDVKVDGQRVADGDDEDLEDNFGLQITIDGPIGKQLRLGARLAGVTASGEATDATYLTADGGLWLRYVFPMQGATPFFGAGGGITWVSIEEDDADREFTGLGWHIAVGLGVEIPGDGVGFTAGLYLTRAHVDPEADEEGVTISLDDGELTRALLAVGFAF